MIEADSFLQGVLQSPEDETLRLVFADWLEDRGDPWGEFIRLQCRLAGMTEWQTGRSGPERREGSLRRRFGPRWAAPLPEWGWKYEFRRGFVTYVEASVESFLEHAAELFDRHPVSSVRLTSFDGTNEVIQQLFSLPQWTRVRHLSLAEGDPIGPRAWARGFDDYRVALLCRSKVLHLDGLELYGRNLTDRVFQELTAWPGLGSLERLALGVFEATPEGLGLLASASLPRLRSFELSHVLVERDRAAWLAHAQWPNLEDLRMASNRLGSEGARNLSRSAFFPNLSELSLSFNALGIRGFLALGEALTPSLRRLEARGNSAGENGGKGVRGIVDAPNARGLEYLGLWSNRLDDSGAEAIANSPHLTGLRELNLGDNRIGPAGAQALAASSALKNVKRIIFRGNRIDCRTAKVFGRRFVIA